MTPLEATPHQFRKVTNDTEAQAILVTHGMYQKLFEHRRPAHLSGEWAACEHFSAHPSHWILAVRYEGFTNAADNGYVLHCFPKSQHSLEDFRRAVRAAMPVLFPHGIEIAESGTL